MLATAELPAGAANVLTGPVGELATAAFGRVDGLDLTGAPDDLAADLTAAATARAPGFWRHR